MDEMKDPNAGFKNKLFDHESQAPEAVWTNIERQLDKPNKKRPFIFWWLPLLLLSGVTAAFFWMNEPTTLATSNNQQASLEKALYSTSETEKAEEKAKPEDVWRSPGIKDGQKTVSQKSYVNGFENCIENAGVAKTSNKKNAETMENTVAKTIILASKTEKYFHKRPMTKITTRNALPEISDLHKNENYSEQNAPKKLIANNFASKTHKGKTPKKGGKYTAEANATSENGEILSSKSGGFSSQNNEMVSNSDKNANTVNEKLTAKVDNTFLEVRQFSKSLAIVNLETPPLVPVNLNAPKPEPDLVKLPDSLKNDTTEKLKKWNFGTSLAVLGLFQNVNIARSAEEWNGASLAKVASAEPSLIYEASLFAKFSLCPRLKIGLQSGVGYWSQKINFQTETGIRSDFTLHPANQNNQLIYNGTPVNNQTFTSEKQYQNINLWFQPKLEWQFIAFLPLWIKPGFQLGSIFESQSGKSDFQKAVSLELTFQVKRWEIGCKLLKWNQKNHLENISDSETKNYWFGGTFGYRF